MADWGDLQRELDAWEGAGETATLWWRDDDAVTATPALQQLIALTLPAGEPLPIALAVIPARADTALAHAVHNRTQVAILQHGYAHTNNAAGTKKAEFPAGRDVSIALHELRLGSRRMEELFGRRALPVLVPPWNRIDPAVVERLPEIRFRGLSAYGPRNPIGGEAGTAVVNTHIDIMRWRGAREFLGTESCLDLAIGHLQARREKRADRTEATGILTHHLVHDAGAWQFVADFVQRTHGHPAVRWMHAAELFGCGESPVA